MKEIPSRAYAALAPRHRRSRREHRDGYARFEVPYVCALMQSASLSERPRRGETVRRFVDRVGWERRGLPMICVETVGGETRPVMRRDWASRRIRKRDGIFFVAMPLGGGGGGTSMQVGAIVALVALAAFAPFAAGAILGAGGIGLTGAALTIGTSLLSAVIIAGGAYLISHFLNNIPKGATTTPTYSVDITSNQARSQQPIPCQYGRLKFFPDLAAPVYSDYSGTNQLFHAIYCLGVGEFDVEEIGVGLTPIWTPGGGIAAGFPNFQYEIIQPGVDSVLFPTAVATSAAVSGQTLPDPYGSTYVDGSRLIGPHGETSGDNYLGPFVVNGAGSSATSIAIDLVWPGGCFATTNGSSSVATSVPITCDYQYVDAAGAATGPWFSAFSKTYTFNSQTPVRVTEPVALPVPGRVQVRLARGNQANVSPHVDTVSWAAAKAYLQGPNAVPGVTRLAVQILADKQLSNYSAQQIYAIATRKVQVWNGTTLSLQATRNPVWAALDVWSDSNYGAALSVNDVDLITLKQYADEADARGDCFDFRFIAQVPIVSALSTVLGVMLSNPVFAWDKLSMVRDEQRTVPAMLLTDFEIVRGSLSVGYTLQDTQVSDGTIVEYFDETTWSSAEARSVADDVVLLQPSRVKPDGITVRRQATVYARYLQASTNYRRKTATLTVEATGKLFKRGDLVAVQSETPNTWGSAVRIDSYDLGAYTVALHTDLDWSSPAQHYIRIKGPTGFGFGPVRCSRGGADNVAFLSSSDVATVATQQGTTLADVLARSSVEELPSAAVSVAEPNEFMGLVTQLANKAENQFEVTLVFDAPEIYTIDTTTVAALPTPSLLALPAMPGVIDPLNAYMKQVGITVTLYVSWNPDPVAQTYTAQISYDSGASWTVVYPEGEIPSFFVAGLAPDDLTLRVRGKSAAGIAGPWSQIIVTAPTVNYQPQNFGYTIQYYDIFPSQTDPTIASDIAELQSFVAAINTDSQVQAAQATASAAATSVIAAITGGFPGLVLDFASQTTGLKAQVAGIQASLTLLQTTEVSDIAALSAEINTLSTTVSGISVAIFTGISVAQATINAATVAQETDLEVAFGVADDQQELQDFAAHVTTAGITSTSLGIISGAQAVVTQQSVANATATQALTQITTTQASQIAANAADIQTVSTTLSTTTGALASRTTSLEASVNSPTTGLTATYNRTTTTIALTTDPTYGNVAIVNSVTALTSTVAGHTASINSQAVTLASQGSTLASLSTTVTANFSTLSGSIASVSASVSTEASARSTADSALSASISSVSASVGTVSANLSSESSARASADSALSSSISSVSAVANNGTASGQIVFSAQAAPAGVSARFSLDLYATGVTPFQSGFYMESVAGVGGRVVFAANTFQIEDPSTRVVPFGISGGVVYLQGITEVHNTIISQLVTIAGSTPGQPYMEQDFVHGAILIRDDT